MQEVSRATLGQVNKYILSSFMCCEFVQIRPTQNERFLSLRKAGLFLLRFNFLSYLISHFNELILISISFSIFLYHTDDVEYTKKLTLTNFNHDQCVHYTKIFVI